MSDILFREATRADVPAIIDFQLAMARETEELELDREILTKGVNALFADPSLGRYYVAEDAGRAVGSLMITYEWSDWRNGDWWWIQSVYVRQDDRRYGVFGALYRHVEAAARAADAVGLRLYVEWANERAQRTYAALGMEREHYHMYRAGFVAFD